MQRLYALSKKGETIAKQEVNYLLGLTEQKLPTKAVEDRQTTVSVIRPPVSRSSPRRSDKKPMWMRSRIR